MSRGGQTLADKKNEGLPSLPPAKKVAVVQGGNTTTSHNIAYKELSVNIGF
jgi:hypothetical protein